MGAEWLQAGHSTEDDPLTSRLILSARTLPVLLIIPPSALPHLPQDTVDLGQFRATLSKHKDRLLTAKARARLLGATHNRQGLPHRLAALRN